MTIRKYLAERHDEWTKHAQSYYLVNSSKTSASDLIAGIEILCRNSQLIVGEMGNTFQQLPWETIKLKEVNRLRNLLTWEEGVIESAANLQSFGQNQEHSFSPISNRSSDSPYPKQH